MLNNSEHPLKHGWFAVKQPATVDLEKNLSAQQRADDEASFFASTAPWNTLAAAVQKRLNTTNLTSAVSRILSNFIASKFVLPLSITVLVNLKQRRCYRIPELQRTAITSLGHTQERIAKLPPPISQDAALEVQSRVTLLIRDLESIAVGREPFKKPVQAANALFERFRLCIRSTAPAFVPFSRDDERFDSYVFPHWCRVWTPRPHVGASLPRDASDFVVSAGTKDFDASLPFEGYACAD
jgi:hypothetical protein